MKNDKHSGAHVGDFVARVPTGRPDVNTATGQPGDHGFAILVPATLLDGKPHSVHVYTLEPKDGPKPRPEPPFGFTFGH